MHAIGPRVNIFSTHVMSMLIALVAVGSSVSYVQLMSAEPDVALRVSEVSFLRKLAKERCDQAYIKFDLQADFTKMWTWNINHMYLYVVAEFATGKHARNEVVVWDSILSGVDDAYVKRTAQWNKYSLKDYGYGLRGTEVTVKLKYNILPYMGPLLYGGIGKDVFALPDNYTSSSVKL